ncbi:MAG: AraC family transcriptional regulator [Pleurocapsa sp. SU_5_0]|nr:AraC family transcriptional regulator [Pleurocapsa sp. SU_5_0]NJR47762.1 AraC family transcriptional regulator [Hyellaceae cyanobacterium CSU_1_1]
MPEAKILRQHLTDKLIFLVNQIPDNTNTAEKTVAIQQLATLTKLVFRSRECLRGIKLEQPIIVVILSGTKIIYVDDREYVFQPGELFFVPSAIALDVINQPDISPNYYTALVLELSNTLFQKVKLVYPELVDDIEQQQAKLQFAISLSPTLAQSLIYLVQSAINSQANSSDLNEHHVMEIILLLLNSDLRSLVMQEIYPNLVTQVTNLLRRDLAQPWTAEQLAQKLNLSVSTLKRQLKSYNLTFRQILTRERMSKAMLLLTQERYAISEVAIACGYQSPSRFAARFKQHYGLKPSEIAHT